MYTHTYTMYLSLSIYIYIYIYISISLSLSIHIYIYIYSVEAIPRVRTARLGVVCVVRAASEQVCSRGTSNI